MLRFLAIFVLFSFKACAGIVVESFEFEGIEESLVRPRLESTALALQATLCPNTPTPISYLKTKEGSVPKLEFLPGPGGNIFLIEETGLEALKMLRLQKHPADLIVFLPSPELTSLSFLPLNLSDVTLLMPDLPLQRIERFYSSSYNTNMKRVMREENYRASFLSSPNDLFLTFNRAIEEICNLHLQIVPMR